MVMLHSKRSLRDGYGRVQCPLPTKTGDYCVSSPSPVGSAFGETGAPTTLTSSTHCPTRGTLMGRLFSFICIFTPVTDSSKSFCFGSWVMLLILELSTNMHVIYHIFKCILLDDDNHPMVLTYSSQPTLKHQSETQEANGLCVINI